MLLLRVLEMAGCMNFSATMTRMAMKVRMTAYSTMPQRFLLHHACAATISLVANSLMPHSVLHVFIWVSRLVMSWLTVVCSVSVRTAHCVRATA